MTTSQNPPSPYLVHCSGGCGEQFLTKQQYVAQMMRPDDRWCCPNCGYNAWWDDANYEKYLDPD